MARLTPHTSRNVKPILDVLRLELRGRRELLEIGSGDGQHATCFAAELGHLDWQTSDRRCNHEAIETWLKSAPMSNVMPPLVLDVLEDSPPESRYDAVFSANTAHIMSEAAVEMMFAAVGRALRKAGRFCLYGPFRQDGCFNSPSNTEFDRALRSRDPSMGIRDLELLDEYGRAHDLHRKRLYAMPANNLIVVWDRQEEAVQ